ncbi:MAG: thiamine diphosphokinase [Clostridia bacterium]
MNALIIAAGDKPSGKAKELAQGIWDLIICADGGAKHALELAVIPDLIVGDFDSLSLEILEAYQKQGINCLRVPKEKDFTDIELAIEKALARGAGSITIAGADGGEFDHELANYFLLAKYIQADCEIRIITSEHEATIISQRKALYGQNGDKFSLLALSPQVDGLTIRGSKYDVENLCLTFGSSRAVRNEFLEIKVEITIIAGILLCIKHWGNKLEEG